MPKIKKQKTSAPKRKKKQLFQSVKGMHDILPKDQDWWQCLLETGWSVAEFHDFNYIETPILEQAALFEAGVGASTDIVEKEMYVFRTKSKEKVALRPEGTAPVMRSYLEHHLGYLATPIKAFEYGLRVRYELSQNASYRQLYHLWFVILGDADAVYDVMIILAVLDFLESLKFKNLILKINAVGCRVCRPTYRSKLKDYYRQRKAKLCKDCLRRYENNILRLLDCKNPDCEELKKNAPIILNYLCSSCNNHFRSTLELIEDNDIPYEPDPYLVRGLDYYNKTVFEIFSPHMENVALAAGGRYDYLSEILGGRPMPAVGVAIGFERVIEAMQRSNTLPPVKKAKKVFFIAIGEQAKKASLKFINELRQSGVKTMESLGKKSLRAQLRSADRHKARLVVIVGQKEIFEESVIIRDMKTGAQETVTIDKLVEKVKKGLR